jgi:hypothetical protein
MKNNITILAILFASFFYCSFSFGRVNTLNKDSSLRISINEAEINQLNTFMSRGPSTSYLDDRSGNKFLPCLEKNYEAKLRLKGDFLDHLSHPRKW